MRFLPGHWALGLWKIRASAAPFLRLSLPNQRPDSVSAVGTTHWAARKRPMRTSGPTKEQKHLRMLCRGGCPHPPAPKCSDLPVGAAPCGRPRFPEPNLSPTTPKGALSTDRRNPKRLPKTQRQR